MIREVVKDTFFLSRKSEECTKNDLNIVQDLMDTLKANQDKCVGMAANMIGFNKNVIVFYDGAILCAMLNPVITKKKGQYTCEEGCLSLQGVRKTDRYHEITVNYQDISFRKHTKKYTGYTAQIIQHEIDHLQGIVI